MDGKTNQTATACVNAGTLSELKRSETTSTEIRLTAISSPTKLLTYTVKPMKDKDTFTMGRTITARRVTALQLFICLRARFFNVTED
jgi:hypothetical protein